MKKLAVGLSATLFALAILSVPQLFSQDTAKAPEPAKAATKREPRGRLPNNYGKLDLTEAQRTQIYAIQAKYKDEVEKLEKQLAELRVKLGTEVESVLTAEQKTKLSEITSAVRKKAQESKAAPPKDAPKAEAPKT